MQPPLTQHHWYFKTLTEKQKENIPTNAKHYIDVMQLRYYNFFMLLTYIFIIGKA